MAQVKTVVARKDYPKFGIERGDTHYVWSMRVGSGGVVRRSKTYPRASQLTMNAYLVAAHSINESLSDFLEVATAETPVDDIQSKVEELVSEAAELRDEQQGKLDAMPDNLSTSPAAEIIEDRISNLEDFINELENLDIDYDEDSGMTEAEFAEELLDELVNISITVS